MAKSIAERVTSSYFFRTNPIIGRLARVEDTDADNCCTYAGITTKLLYFIAMVVVGVVTCMLLTYKDDQRWS